MKRVLALTLLLVAIVSIYTLPSLVYASIGDLDPSFGINGKARTHIAGTDADEINAVVLQPDGKIIVAGQTFNAATSLYHLALARYNSDGTLDQTFGNAGTVVGNFPNRTERALAVALQADGRVVVAGQTKLTNDANSGDFLLARYNSNGSLDTSFGTGGMTATDFNGISDEARAVAVQSNGKFIVAGSGGTSNSFALARYNSNGTLDTFFSASGKATLTFGGYNGGATALALQADGKIVVAGTGSFSSNPDFAVARLNADGNPDFSFGVFSVVTTDFSSGGSGNTSSDSAQALAIQSDGKIVVAGRGQNTFALARYNTNGSADTTFGNTGKVAGLPLSANSSGGATGLALQADGRIVAGGSVFNVSGNGTFDFALARYNTNGGLDQAFGTNGVSIADISGNTLDDFANALQLQPDGKVVLAGTVISNGSNQLQRDFAVARYQGGSSSPNCSFTIGQTARTFQSSGGTGNVAVITGGGCNWTAVSNATWLSITSGASGTGNGTVSYTVAANSSTSSRTGTMTIAGWTFTVTQDGATPAPTSVQFSASIYNVTEDGGSATVIVTRTGSTSAAATVGYTTSDTAGLTNCDVINGIASSRCDYATSVGTVRFASGETSKTISIPIVDDNFTEGNENLTITLSNPSGAILGSISTATVTITDNANTSGNPIDSVPFFVRQHYIDFLGREPDSFGFKGWQDILNNCASGDTRCDRIEVSSGFFRSPEFQERGYFVYRFYSVSLGRKPNYVEFMPDIAKVSGFLTEAEKEANKVAFVNEFMQRSEFKTRYDSLTDPAAYVDALLNTAGLPNHPSRAGWIAGLQNSTLTRARVLRELAESGEAYDKFYNQAFVVMQYFGYLRRDPDKFYLDWIQIMEQDPQNYRNMVNGFVNSLEYRNRFAP